MLSILYALRHPASSSRRPVHASWMLIAITLLLGVSTISPTNAANPARLVKDINTTTMDAGPTEFGAVGNTVYFAADDGVHGWELWASDGTAIGTHLVKDIAVGNDQDGQPRSSGPSVLTAIAGIVFFVADDGLHGSELWASDGTAPGTRLVRDITPGVNRAPLQPANLTDVDGRLFFTDSDGVNGVELWTSDGTAQGTVMVRDIDPGAPSSSPDSLTAMNSILYFAASDSVYGRELWASNGTSAGTAMVVDLFPGTMGVSPLSSSPAALTNVNSVLYFIATNQLCYVECPTQLWKSDGTAGGTVLVKDLRVSGYTTSPSLLTGVNGTLFFVASRITCTRTPSVCSGFTSLWKSDGAPDGTIPLATISTDVSAGHQRHIELTNVRGKLFFVGNDPEHGDELWQSDGSAAGTRLVKDIRLGPAGSVPEWLVDMNGTLFFAANNETGSWQLWRSNGTMAGTVQVARFNSSSTIFPQSEHPLSVSGQLFLKANRGGYGEELWKSDGTPSGTVLVLDINREPSGSSSLYRFSSASSRGKLFFTADDGSSGAELWESDGTQSSTILVKDIMPGFGSANPQRLIDINGTLFFVATDPGHGSELWRSDGSAQGTALVRDLQPGPDSSDPGWLINVDGTLFFVAYDSQRGRELWKSDGTEAGTVLVKDIFPGDNDDGPSEPTSINDVVLFILPGTYGPELWRSDGTAENTRRVKEWNGQYLPSSGHLTNVNGVLFFVIDDGIHGIELWKSDGTEAGTVLVRDINPGANNSSPSDLLSVQNRLFFTAFDPSDGKQLWMSDGTAAGTIPLTRFDPNTTDFQLRGMAGVGEFLYFTADIDPSRRQLWRSDGTVAGTGLIKEIGSEASGPVALNCYVLGLLSASGQLFFTANDGQSGCELWISDGTSAGTHLFQDIAPGLASSFPSGLRIVGLQVFFTADDARDGRELWSMNTATSFAHLPLIRS